MPQEDGVAERPPQDFPPGPNEPTDELVVDDVELRWEPGTDHPLVASLTVRNTTDTTRAVMVPTLRPRIEVEDEGARLTYLRLDFGEDGTEVGPSQVGAGIDVSVAAGESHTIERSLPVAPDRLTERIQVCVEVMPPPAPGAPAESEESGVERDGVAPFYPDPGADAPVPVACSDWVEVPPDPGEG